MGRRHLLGLDPSRTGPVDPTLVELAYDALPVWEPVSARGGGLVQGHF